MRIQHPPPRRRLAAVLGAALAFAPLARGQGPEGAVPAPPPGAAGAGDAALAEQAGREGQAGLEVGYGPIAEQDGWKTAVDEGLFVRSRGGGLELSLQGLLRVDGRWNGTDRRPETELALPAAELQLAGRLAGTVRFQLAPDFERQELEQAWAGVELGEGLATAFAGRSTVPFGLENVRSTKGDDLPRRSILAQLAPPTELGAFVYGGGPDRVLEWGLAGYDGSNPDSPAGEDGVAARLAAHPFARSGGALEHLHVGVAATWGQVDGPVGGATIDNAAGLPVVVLADDARLDGDRRRLGLELAWRRGPWFAQAELMRVTQDMQGAGGAQAIDTDGWYVQLSRTLTGEARSYAPRAPARPISTRDLSGRGAWTLALRVSELSNDPALAASGLAVPGGFAGDVRSVWLGVDWTLRRQLALRAGYVHSFYSEDLFLDGQAVGDEGAVVVQLQLAF